MIVNSILNLLLREGGVPVGGGGRWIHNPVIYKEIGINIIFPTTSVFDHSSFPKEEIRDRIDFLISPNGDTTVLFIFHSKWIKQGKKECFFGHLVEWWLFCAWNRLNLSSKYSNDYWNMDHNIFLLDISHLTSIDTSFS